MADASIDEKKAIIKEPSDKVFFTKHCKDVSADEIKRMITGTEHALIDGKMIRFANGQVCKIDWKRLMKISEGFYTSSSLKVIPVVDNIQGIFEPRTSLGTSSICFANFKKRGVSFFFSEEEPDMFGDSIHLDSESFLGKLTDTEQQEYEGVIVIFPFNDNIEKQQFSSFFNFSNKYNITGFLIEVPKKTGRGIVEMEKIILVSSYSEFQEDFSSLQPLLKRITSINDLSLVWDFDNDLSIYSGDEMYVLLSNLFFYEYNVPAFHLTLCGPQRAARKSTWLSMVGAITGDEIVRCEGSTYKGLVPSFYDKKIDPGKILRAKFCFLGDEFFRAPAQSSEETSSYVKTHKFLVSMMGLFDKKIASFTSGKCSGSFVFTKSFFATDNMKVSNELRQMFENDPAPLRRFNFMIVSQETEGRGDKVFGELDEPELLRLTENRLKNACGLSFKNYLTLLKFMRACISHVVYDRQRMHKIQDAAIEKIKPENALLPTPKTERWKDLAAGIGNATRACIKSATVIGVILRWNLDILPSFGEFVANEDDYALAERMVERLIFDKTRVLTGHSSEETGVQRFSGIMR